jgi:type I restriction enzyme S subunit
VSVELLLRQFNRVGEAADALPRLRRFVADLAVRGLLVEQDAADEPAEVFLEGRCISPEDIPFPLPQGWCWTSLARLGQVLGGGTPSKSQPDFWGGTVPWVTPKDMKRERIGDSIDHISDAAIAGSSVKLIPAGSLLMVVRGMILAHSFPTALTTAPVTVNQDMKALVPFDAGLQDMLLLITKGMRTPILRLVERSTHGTGRLATSALLELPIPMPPIDEQRRIVNKMAEFMALCDQLEAVQTDRESQRDALRFASLYQLTASGEIGKKKRGVQFFLDTSQRLITKPEHVPTLKQAILDLAVQGRLVPQDLRDEPAASLLADWDPLPDAASADDSEMDTPCGWEVATVGQLASMVTSGSRGWAEYYTPTGASFLRAQNIRFGHLRLSEMAHVTLPQRSEGTRTRLEVGDVLIVITGAGVTNPALLDVELGEAYVSQHVGLVKLRRKELGRWVLLCLMAPAGSRKDLVARAYGAGKPGLNLDNIRTLRLPLPPLDEQRRILAKVDELMAVCDELQDALTSAQEGRGHVLDAMLHEALHAGAETSARPGLLSGVT